MTAYYNEFDPYAAQWLRNLIAKNLIAPGDVDERSIFDVQPDDLKGYTQCHFFAGIGGWSYAARLAGYPDDRELWTGSCPCQPFSVAGKQQGKEDERHLWPIFFDLIGARRPAVVMGEQVAAAVGKDWLDGVHSDLESIGYACGAAVVPACAVDAPHKRDRLWFVADATAPREGGRGLLRSGQGASEINERSSNQSARPCDRHVDNAFRSGLEGQRRHGDDWNEPGWIDAQQIGSVAAAGRLISHTDEFGPGASWEQRGRQFSGIGSNSRNRHWAGSEWAIGADGKARRFEPGIRLLAHGVSGRMAVRRTIGQGTSAHQEEHWYNRIGVLRGFGNAIVPQVAAEVIGAYMEIAA